MTDTNQCSEDEKLARLFHDTYERLAPAFSYKTRKASAVPWAEVPPNNKGLMIAVAHAVNALTRTEKLKLLLAEVRERVIGQDVTQTERHWSDEYGDYCGKGKTMIKGECICEELNGLKAEQRDILTKLEAEL